MSCGAPSSECEDRPLRRAVARQQLHPEERLGGGIDDPTGTGGDQVGPGGLGYVESAEEVHIEHRSEVRHRERLKFRRSEDAGVVDNGVEAAEGVDGGLDNRGRAGFVIYREIWLCGSVRSDFHRLPWAGAAAGSIDSPAWDNPFAPLTGDLGDVIEVCVVVEQNQALLFRCGRNQKVRYLAPALASQGQ